jgi:hypothetical protein
MSNKTLEYKEKILHVFWNKMWLQKETTIKAKEQIKSERWTTWGTKNRDHGTKHDFKWTKASAKEQIESE